MKGIKNLDDLRSVADSRVVDAIVTQYMMETIVGGNILKRFKDSIKNMDDSIKIDVRTIKGMIESCEEAEVGVI